MHATSTSAAKSCLRFGNNMSRVGKQIITIPQGTDVSVADGMVTVKGKHGEITRALSAFIAVEIKDGTVAVNANQDTQHANALRGTFVSHIQNMIHGVNEQFSKSLSVEGIGFKVALQGDKLVLNVGFSHPVELVVPEGLKAEVEKNIIKITGIDKEKVGQFAAEVRAVKKPEPYKGKGIRYSDEVVRRKQGKRAGA